MIARHARLARQLAERARAARPTSASALGRVVRAVGRQGLPGELAGEDDPARRRASRSWPSTSRSRTAPAASPRPSRSPGAAAGKQFDPALVACVLDDDADAIFDGLDELGTWNAVIDAEPALTVALSTPDSSTRRCTAIADFVDLKSPFTLGHSERTSPSSAAGAGAHARARRRRDRDAAPGRARARASVGSASRTRSGTSRARSPSASGSGCGMHPYFTERMLQQSEALAPLGADRGRSTASGSTAPATPAGCPGSAISPSRPHPGRRRRLPGDARTAPPPAGARTRRRGRSELRAEVQGRAPRRRCGRRRARRGRPPHGAPARRSRRAHRPRGRGPHARRPRAVEQADRRTTGHLARRPPATTSSTSTRRSAPATGSSASLFAMQHGPAPRRRRLTGPVAEDGVITP